MQTAKTTVRGPSSESRLRSPVVAALLVCIVVITACRGVEDVPAGSTIEVTTSTTSNETTSSGSEAHSDSAVDVMQSEVDLEWTEAELSGTTFVDHLLATEDGFVAYRFAHGAGTWVSQDGILWARRDLLFETDSDEFVVDSLTVGGPGYVAIGTDPVTVTDDDYPAVWVSDDGFDWERHDLVVESPALGRFAGINVMSVVGGPDGRLILLGRMDPPDGEFDEHAFVVWISQDGLEWSLQSDPFPPGSYIDHQVYATAQGFIANGYIEGGDSGDVAWLSADGEHWEELSFDFTGEVSPETAVIRGATRRVVSWDDRILTVGGTADGISLWVSNDDGSWTALPPNPTIGHTDDSIIIVDDIAAGPAGIVLTGQFEPRPPEPQPFTPATVEKGQRVVTVDFEAGTLTVADVESEEVLLEIGLDEADSLIRTDDESLTVIDPETSEELISVTHEEWSRALEDAGLGEPDFDESPPVPKMWISPDGEKWTVVDVEETFGIDDIPSEVVVGVDSVLVKWSGLELTGYEEAETTGELEDPPDVMWVARWVDAP